MSSPARLRFSLWSLAPLLAIFIGGTVLVVSATRAAVENPEGAPKDVAQAIQAVLEAQARAWNEGDIDRFMETYWKSEQLTFSSGGQTTRGWIKTKESYVERYPTRERMGKVSFTELEVTLLGDSAAMVLGRWKLDRDAEPLAGNFTLVLRKLDDRWLIIHDHTSRGE